MAGTWLKPKREAERLSQQNVADHLGLDVRVYRRWERCESEAKKEVPYTVLAGLLKVSAVQLCEDHLRDLQAAGQQQHAARARIKLNKLHRAHHFPPVDPAPIEAALEACSATGLVRDIGERMKVSEPAQQAARIACWLGEDQDKAADKDKATGPGRHGLEALFEAINSPLQHAIERSNGQQQRTALWHFLLAVMHGGAASDRDIGAGGQYSRQGEERAWTFRLLIDNARRLNGMRTVTLHPQEPSYRLDDGRDSTRAVPFRALTQTSVEGRVHELVKEIAATLALDNPPPPVAETAAFADYCKVVNAALASHNYRDSHVFALCGPDSQETDAVKERLRGLLNNLTLFDCGDTRSDSTVLRVDRDELEGWYALHLHELSQRGHVSEPQADVRQKTDETTPTENNVSKSAAQNVVNVNVQTGNGNSSAQAGGDAQIAQQTTTALPDQVAALIEQILSDSKDRKQDTKDLRQAALKAQAELEADGAVSTQTKGRLQRAFDALPRADALINTGAKLLKLMAQWPGVGT